MLDFSTIYLQSVVLWSALLLVQIHGMLAFRGSEEFSLIVSPLGTHGTGLTFLQFNLYSSSSAHSSCAVE